MKNFADTLKLFFVIAGAVMGAGFLSGGELIAFFGGVNLFCLALAAAVFFIGFSFVRTENDCGSKSVFMLAELVFSLAMLSGLDEIAGYAGILKGVPAASIISLFIFHFSFSKDIKKVEKVNCVLIPVSCAIVLSAAIFAPAQGMAVKGTSAVGVINALLYACMNLFVALPSVHIAKKSKSKRANVAAALCFSVFFTLFAFIILRVAPKTALPLIDISYGTALYPLLIAAIFIGSFTSLICYLYPLKNFIVEKTAEKRRGAYCFLLYALLFILSRAGISAIIKYCYPLVGALGLVSIVKSFFGIKGKAKGDTMGKRSALCQKRKRVKSKNLPKKNTATI